MQLTRLELYKRVCDSPLSKVAPELGISGTALAAICKQYQVPYPDPDTGPANRLGFRQNCQRCRRGLMTSSR
jgi:hypothetical protein